MEVNITNPVLQDIVSVIYSEDIRDIVITDKIYKLHKKDKNNKKVTYIPMIIYKPNIYKGMELKIKNYMDQLDYYEGLGFENVEQYLCCELYRTQRAVGNIKDIGKYTDEYLKNTPSIKATGFVTLSEFLEYKIFKKRARDKDDTGKIYSLKTEYEKSKVAIMQSGIYSFQDYIKYNSLIENALINYGENGYQIDKNDFLRFELREFSWKKEYYELKGSLKNIQKYINKKYLTEYEIPKNIMSLDIEYVNCPAYYYENFNLHNISEYIELQKKIRTLEDKYRSLYHTGKVTVSRIVYLKQELGLK